VARCFAEATVRASAPRQVVWDVLADLRSWDEWGDWQATDIEQEGDPPPYGVGAIRRLVQRPLTMKERVELYEPPSRFGYELLAGLPMRDYHALVTLSDAGEGATNIHWQARFDGHWRALDRPMRRFIGYVLRTVTAKLAAEAERRS
jgi:Polyketide cyclase / dehydrase and lipid transport